MDDAPRATGSAREVKNSFPKNPRKSANSQDLVRAARLRRAPTPLRWRTTMRTHLARGEYTPGKLPTTIPNPPRNTAQQKPTPRNTAQQLQLQNCKTNPISFC